MDEAERFHRVTMMHKGKILGIGSPDEFKSRLLGRVYELYTSDMVNAYNTLKRRNDFESVVSAGQKIVIEAKDGESPEQKIKDFLMEKKIELRSFEPSEATMASVFVSSVKSFEEKEKTVRVKDLFEQYSSTMTQEYRHDKEMVVAIQGIVKDFGRFRAVDHVSFNI